MQNLLQLPKQKFVLFKVCIVLYLLIYVNSVTYTINPVSQTNLGFQSDVVVVDYNDEFAYVSSIEGQLQKIDIKNNNEALYNQEVCPKVFEMVLIQEDKYLLVACNDQGLKVLKLNSDEGFSDISKAESQEHHAVYVVSVDTKVYVQTDTEVVIYDFSNPDNYSKVGVLQNVGWSQLIDVSSDHKYLFCAKDAFGFEVYDISNINNPILVTSDIFEGGYGVKSTKLHPTSQHVFVTTKWDYLGVVNYGQYYGQESNYPVEFSLAGKYIDPTYSEKFDMHVSKDGSALYLTCNSQGIFVLDITQIDDIKLVQVMEQSGLIKRMKLPQNNLNYVYLTNSRDLIIYQQVQPIYKQNNLFTAYQSEKWWGPTQEVWPWTQALTKNNTILYVMLIVDGVRVYDLTQLPKMTLLHEYKDPIIPGLDSPFHVTVDIVNDDIIYIGNYNNEGIFIMDFSDLANPVKLSSIFIEDNIGYSCHVIFADPNKIIINQRTKIVILNVEDKQNPQIYSENEPTEYPITQFRKGKASNDGQYIYMPETVLGQLFTFQVSSNFRTIVNVDVQQMEMAYLIEMSKINDNVMYGLVNLGGLYVYDITEGIPEIKVYVQLEGFLWDMDMDWKEDNMFIVATSRNQLQVIDISNPFSSYLINIFQVNSEQGFQVILVSGELIKDYVIINTFTGIRAVPIDVDVSLNIQVFNYDTEQQKYVDYVQPQNQNYLFPVFFVGEKGKSQFQVLNDPFGQKIDQFYYYTIEQPTLLIENTSVVSFDTTKKEITFQAQKGNLGINTVVTKVFIQIDVEELVNTEQENVQVGDVDQDDEFLVSQEIAEQIFQKTQEFGYISLEGFPTDMFDINKKIILLDEIQQYADYLKNIIKKKIQYVPFTFVVVESLNFNNLLEKSLQDQQIIKTFAESVEVYFQVDKQYAEFFNILYEGVLSSYSQNRDELIIQGKIASINLILNQIKLEVFDKSQIDEIFMYIKIDDYLNYSQDFNLMLNDVKFIKINNHVKQGKSIQEQFNELYSSGSVTVEEEFSFSFGRESFIDDDEVTYSLFIFVEDENQEYQISQYTSFENFEINFVDSQRMIKGLVNRNMFRTSLSIRISASDGYSVAEQELIIKLNGVPIIMVIEYIIICGSALLSVIGGIQYRGKLYGIFCKSRYRLGNIYVQENENFIIQILLGKEDMKMAQSHYKILKIYLSNRGQNFNEFLDMTYPGTYALDREKIKRILVIQQPQVDQLGYEHDESITYCMLKSLIYKSMMKKKRKVNNLFDKMKSFAMKNSGLNKHRWYEYYVEVKPVEVNNYYDITPKVFFKEVVILNALKILVQGKKIKKNIKQQLMDELLQLKDLQFQCYELEDPIFADKLSQLPEDYEDFKIFLLLENLKTEALGFQRTSLINYTFGQTVMKSTQMIKVARAMVKRKSIFTKLFSYINLDYIDIPLAVNTPLPQWMDYKQHHNVLEIYGKIPVDDSLNPEKKDLVIRIEDIFDFTCREFHIVQVRNQTKNKIIHYTDYKAPDLKLSENELEENEEGEEQQLNNDNKQSILNKLDQQKVVSKCVSPQINSVIQNNNNYQSFENNALVSNQTPRLNDQTNVDSPFNQYNEQSYAQMMSQRQNNYNSNGNSFLQQNQENFNEKTVNNDQMNNSNKEITQQQYLQQQFQLNQNICSNEDFKNSRFSKKSISEKYIVKQENKNSTFYQKESQYQDTNSEQQKQEDGEEEVVQEQIQEDQNQNKQKQQSKTSLDINNNKIQKQKKYTNDALNALQME